MATWGQHILSTCKVNVCSISGSFLSLVDTEQNNFQGDYLSWSLGKWRQMQKEVMVFDGI